MQVGCMVLALIKGACWRDFCQGVSASGRACWKDWLLFPSSYQSQEEITIWVQSALQEPALPSSSPAGCQLALLLAALWSSRACREELAGPEGLGKL